MRLKEMSPTLSRVLRELSTRSRSRRKAVASEVCACQPLASSVFERQGASAEGLPEVLLVSRDLAHSLRAVLVEQLAQSQELSILVLHVFQHEVTPMVGAMPSTTRRRYHVEPVILDQVLANVRRVIRDQDAMLIHARTGAAILFSGVDPQGMAQILERVYDSLDLLQGETLQPPLKRETTIQLGIASYPAPATSLHQLLAQATRVARRLNLQPALSRQLYGVKPVPSALPTRVQSREEQLPSIPFMELPERVPANLTTVLPYGLARELRCVPVGRHQHTLTVALADPANRELVQRLQTATGLAIFPVACEREALDRLLARRW